MFLSYGKNRNKVQHSEYLITKLFSCFIQIMKQRPRDQAKVHFLRGQLALVPSGLLYIKNMFSFSEQDLANDSFFSFSFFLIQHVVENMQVLALCH